MDLEHYVERFFQKMNPRPKKLLLAFSGGSDSMALLHALLSFRGDFELGVAHVDHRWRKESAEEAQDLRAYVSNLKLPFFLHTLNPSSMRGNLEQESRKARLAFFQKVCEEEKYEAVILAHHAKDQAETVLKRCLEGSHLSALAGMEEKKSLAGITLLRPLLTIRKEAILQYLTGRGIRYICDATNEDPHFLRGRMRVEIFPDLEKKFGKNVENSLCRLASEALELKEYFKEKLKPIFGTCVKSPFGLHVDLNALDSSFEIKWFINELFKSQEIPLSCPLLHTAASLLYKRKANRKIETGGLHVYIDRGHLFIVKKWAKLQPEPVLLRPGNFTFGDWKIVVSKAEKVETPLLGWREVWKGQCRALLPPGNFFMGVPENALKSALDRFWTEQKVPAFLRGQVPVLFNEANFIQEFLTGKTQANPSRFEGALTVSLYRETPL